MKSEIIIATKNQNKVHEFKQMLEPMGYLVKSLLDYKDFPEIEEDGFTFEDNARIKAETASKLLGCMVISDDSGLEIDAFDGQPGVYSARWLGELTPYRYKNQVILDRMRNEENRLARYVCVLALARPNQETIFFRGECEVEVAFEAKGEHGFGYDPIMLDKESGKTLAEMSDEEKAAISHRGIAVRQLKEWFEYEMA
ncbi:MULTISPECIES: RdgB/HAM1 family non-canonical purine NTP pyrophosphatase [Terrabacteria group]|uniref:RdgB/HAM1 family non-canonical purine NTP pyrophosphatase n=1 Tax=Bacillati TaxID=1783272 RepID=UPI0019394395|nr:MULTISPECIES: RdgB/HAM1 family non-canonical purine NTP pyrophosphatase [Terrabacteria group]MBW9211860.1 RdgB/HAM1 family non-canonical purine NTP pyrophosphatase [Trueperella sp. zg.1013]QRG87336.1 RdgB/HAM1 family non-canonical purine NTP pyrophosphatase [Bulleidia sp. zg-1006]